MHDRAVWKWHLLSFASGFAARVFAVALGLVLGDLIVGGEHAVMSRGECARVLDAAHEFAQFIAGASFLVLGALSVFVVKLVVGDEGDEVCVAHRG